MGLGLGNIVWLGVAGSATVYAHEFDMEFSQTLFTATEITTVFEVDTAFTQTKSQRAEITGTFDEDPELGIGVNKPTDR
jgi:hypothetical protein